MTHQADHLGDDLLSALVDDQLSEQDKTQANPHLGTCTLCQQRLEELRAVATLLRRLPEVDLPRDFSLGPRLHVQAARVVHLSRWYAATRIAAATLAAAWLFLTAGALYVGSRSAAPVETAASVPALAPAPAARNAPALPSAIPATKPQAVARALPNPQPDDQVAAATSVNPLPTQAPTPQPTAIPLPVVPPVANSRVDLAALLGGAALVVGPIAILAAVMALFVRHRLQRAASHL